MNYNAYGIICFLGTKFLSSVYISHCLVDKSLWESWCPRCFRAPVYGSIKRKRFVILLLIYIKELIV